MLIEVKVKPITFGMIRYSNRCWHLGGAKWTEHRAAEAVNERGDVVGPGFWGCALLFRFWCLVRWCGGSGRRCCG